MVFSFSYTTGAGHPGPSLPALRGHLQPDADPTEDRDGAAQQSVRVSSSQNYSCSASKELIVVTMYAARVN